MKKSKISAKCIWFLYSLIAAALFWMMSVTVSAGIHIEVWIVLGVGVGMLAVVCLIAFLLRRLILRKKGIHFQGSVLLSKVTEIALFLVGMIGTAYMRFSILSVLDGNQVYESVKVYSSSFHSTAVHNGYRIYLNLLHEALVLIGNKLVVAMVLQVILQLGAIFFLYFSIRRISGVPAALVTMFFMGFAPYLFLETMQFSAFWFVMFFYSLALWRIICITEAMEKMWEEGGVTALILDCVFTGILTGFSAYLDAVGLTLLIFMVGVIWCSEFRSRKMTAWLSCLIPAFVSFIFFVDLFPGSAENVTSTLWNYLELIKFNGLSIPDSVAEFLLSWDVIGLVLLLSIGIVSYFFRMEIKDRAMWFFSFLVMTAMQCLGLLVNEPINVYAVLFFFCVAMAGCNVEDMFYFKERKVKSKNMEAETEENRDEDQEELPVERVENNAPDGAGRPQDESVEQEKIEFIENPLPVPPKHVKKVLDYDYPVADDDDFDIQ